MKDSSNRIDPESRFTPGIEGYVYDGVNESQMAFWTYKKSADSESHSHDFDEYVVVVQGQYTILMENKSIILNSGDEYLIPKGVFHGGKADAGTRAIYAFGGKRAFRG